MSDSTYLGKGSEILLDTLAYPEWWFFKRGDWLYFSPNGKACAFNESTRELKRLRPANRKVFLGWNLIQDGKEDYWLLSVKKIRYWGNVLGILKKDYYILKQYEEEEKRRAMRLRQVHQCCGEWDSVTKRIIGLKYDLFTCVFECFTCIIDRGHIAIQMHERSEVMIYRETGELLAKKELRGWEEFVLRGIYRGYWMVEGKDSSGVGYLVLYEPLSFREVVRYAVPFQHYYILLNGYYDEVDYVYVMVPLEVGECHRFGLYRWRLGRVREERAGEEGLGQK